MKPILKTVYDEFKEIDRYDFTHPKFVYYEGLRMSKYDIAYHLEVICSPYTPWTIMFDVYYYEELKKYLKTRLNNLKNEKSKKRSI